MRLVTGEQSGKVYPLSPAAVIGRGAEGCAYLVSGVVVKVYAKDLLPERVEKTRFFILYGKQFPGFAWPLDLALDGSGAAGSRKIFGEIQPAIDGETLEELLGDWRPGQPVFTEHEKVEICLAIAKAVEAIHACKAPKVVLRDCCKAGNVILDGTKATFIDATSACVLGFRRTNGQLIDAIEPLATPGYMPKEVLENPKAKPAHSDDLFSLAVLLFQIVFGRMPTDNPAGGGVDDPDENVKRGIYPRYTTTNTPSPIYDPVNPPNEVEELFRLAFLSATDRPSAARWVAALTNWKRNLPANQTGRPWRIRVRLSAGLGRAALVALLLGLAAAAVWQDRRQPPPPPVETRPVQGPAEREVGPAFFKEFFK